MRTCYENLLWVVINTWAVYNVTLCFSFTISMWYYLLNMNSSYPLVCTQSELICLSLEENGTVLAQHGLNILQMDTNTTSHGWSHIIYRYDAEGIVRLFSRILNYVWLIIIIHEQPKQWSKLPPRNQILKRRCYRFKQMVGVTTLLRLSKYLFFI